MFILVCLGLISIMAIYFYFDNGSFMPYLVVAYSAAVIIKLFVEVNEVSYLKKIHRLQKQQILMLRHLINKLDEYSYSNLPDKSLSPNLSDKSLSSNSLVQDVSTSQTLDSPNNRDSLQNWMNNYVKRESDVFTKLGHHNSFPNTTLYDNYKEFCKHNNFDSYSLTDFKKYLMESLSIYKDMKHELSKFDKSDVITNIRLLVNK